MISIQSDLKLNRVYKKLYTLNQKKKRKEIERRYKRLSK